MIIADIVGRIVDPVLTFIFKILSMFVVIAFVFGLLCIPFAAVKYLFF